VMPGDPRWCQVTERDRCFRQAMAEEKRCHRHGAPDERG
jgi:hypothetical protein